MGYINIILKKHYLSVSYSVLSVQTDLVASIAACPVISKWAASRVSGTYHHTNISLLFYIFS
jgi:hypothetical protein